LKQTPNRQPKVAQSKRSLPTDRYLEDTIADAKKKQGSQHAINKEVLIKIIEELLEWRKQKSI